MSQELETGAARLATGSNGRTDAAGGRHLGLIGLAVMGENLALNIARNGYPMAVYNRSQNRTRAFSEGKAAETDIVGAYDLRAFVAALERPRRVILLVKAGAPVDAVVADLVPLLEPGDMVIDGGNSFFQDTERRSRDLTATGVLYVGMGVSGGEEGALNGPSLMPGGPREAYDLLAPVLTDISAKTEAGPCVTYIGPGGSGHYVKMVHNGIEYGDMQLIAETYDVMRRTLGLEAAAMSDIFARWNEGKLASYLVEVTSAVLAYRDEETGLPLVDVILDQAEQKGTGRWTTQNALELGTPTPTIDAAVAARILSSRKAQRVAASRVLHGPDREDLEPGALVAPGELDRDRLIAALEDALYFAKVSSYAQGMALLRVAGETYGYGLDLAEIARIWKGGCIIRAALLDPIREAYGRQPDLDNLLLAPAIAETVNASMPGCRHAIRVARAFGIPCPALSASLDYVDTVRQERLPANLVQAQRDYFGAHTYKRLDKEGTFHTAWTPAGSAETVKSVPSRRQLWAEGEGEGERSPRLGSVPAKTAEAAAVPSSGAAGDPETGGDRSPEATKKGEF